MDTGTPLATTASAPQAADNPRFELLLRLRRNKMAMAGAGIVAVLLLTALTAGVLAPHNPLAGNIVNRLQPPSHAYWLGTDSQGRDILSRIIFGTRISLEIGVISVGLALVIGTLLGTASGFYGGWLDLVLMRVMDIMLAFPSVLLAIAITAMLGPSLKNAMIAVGIVYIPSYARIVRSTVLSVKETEYVEAARVIGCSTPRIVFRHVLPNCLAPLIVQTTMSIGTAILDAAGLSFLGLGAQPPTPEWGAMLSEGRSALQEAPWVMVFPGLAIMLVVLGFNLLGDGLRDALDPRLRF